MEIDEFPEFRDEKKKRWRKYLICATVILMFVIWVLISHSIRQKEIEKQRREWVPYVQELPRHGEQRNFGDTEERECTRYNFTSPAIAWNVLIRFFDSDRKVLVAEVFCRRGEHLVEVSLPRGIYDVKCASGDDEWYGEERLWGCRTCYRQGRAPLKADGESLEGHWRGKSFERSFWNSSGRESFRTINESESF